MFKIFYMKYIKIIKDIMKKQNLSQSTLANILGVNQTTVSQWLLGRKRPSFENVLMFYEKFGITPNVFFGVEDYFD